MLESYPSLEDFYAENEERRRSGEADYGCWWTKPGQSWPRWRVSYVQKTGEVYAVQLTGRKVEVLGVVPTDDDHLYYRTLDAILDGWADVIHQPSSLDWVKARLNIREGVLLNEQDY